jgi:hypothetical protein
MKALGNVKHVALTRYCWTSITNDGYMTVTVHYFSGKYPMVSKVLNIIAFEASHTSENLAKELKAIFVV